MSWDAKRCAEAMEAKTDALEYALKLEGKTLDREHHIPWMIAKHLRRLEKIEAIYVEPRDEPSDDQQPLQGSLGPLPMTEACGQAWHGECYGFVSKASDSRGYVVCQCACHRK